MSYTHDLIFFASKFEQPICVEYNKERNIYKVYIDKVHFKDGHARRNIVGSGSTIEDACNHYISLARGGKIVHFLTDQEEEII